MINVGKKTENTKTLSRKRKQLKFPVSTGPPSKTYKCDDTNSSQAMIGPNQTSSSGSEYFTGIIDSKCRGCGSIFTRITKHLQPSKLKYTECMKHYSYNELEVHKKKLQTIQHIRHNAKGTEYT